MSRASQPPQLGTPSRCVGRPCLWLALCAVSAAFARPPWRAHPAPLPPFVCRADFRRTASGRSLSPCSPPPPPPSPFQINPYVSELSLYDIAGTPGVAADLSHINSKAVVKVRRRESASAARARARSDGPANGRAAARRPSPRVCVGAWRLARLLPCRLLQALPAEPGHTHQALVPPAPDRSKAARGRAPQPHRSLARAPRKKKRSGAHAPTPPPLSPSFFFLQGYAGPDQLHESLKGADVIIIPAGVPRKPGMTRDDLFKINAGIVRDLVAAAAEVAPGALLNIISNPVNSTVPIAAEVLKQKGVYDPRKLFGVTTLDVVRARTFYAGAVGADVAGVEVPVVGGHAGITILPLFSQATPAADLGDKLGPLTSRTQDGGTEVVTAKAGKGSATLSMAYAGALFADACMRGLNGEPGVVECTYVESTVTDARFFASKVRLGPEGVAEVMGLGKLTAFEQAGLDALLPELKESIEKGVAFARGE